MKNILWREGAKQKNLSNKRFVGEGKKCSKMKKDILLIIFDKRKKTEFFL